MGRRETLRALSCPAGMYGAHPLSSFSSGLLGHWDSPHTQRTCTGADTAVDAVVQGLW